MRRHRIDILSPPIGNDDYGSPDTVWPIYKAGIWADKKDILGNEYFAAQTKDTKVETKFNTGYVKGVNRKMRIKYGNETYEILDVINVNSRNLEMLYYCKLVD